MIYDWTHTRKILAALCGKDERFIIPLPGDFEDVKQKVKPVEKLRQMFRADKIWGDG